MGLKEQAEETLETLWILTEEKKKESISLDDLATSEKKSLQQLLGAGYISLSDNRVMLTRKGRPEARNVIRRHRLAERLLTDVLGTGDILIHEKACKFEHLLDRGLDENICILLGHPKVCPHGRPIPPGRCCHEGQAQVQRVIAPLSQLAQGQKGKVAYIYAPESGQLQKLMAMGIIPGAPVSLIQSFPSYVFQVRQTQFAVDKEIADTVYVRLEEDTTREAGEELTPKPGRHRGSLSQRLGLRWSKPRG
jgi:DtxR family Mn-dependent transcriptional regulator